MKVSLLKIGSYSYRHVYITCEMALVKETEVSDKRLKWRIKKRRYLFKVSTTNGIKFLILFNKITHFYGKVNVCVFVQYFFLKNIVWDHVTQHLRSRDTASLTDFVISVLTTKIKIILFCVLNVILRRKRTLTCLGLVIMVKYWHYLGRAKRIWYLSPMRAAKVQASLRIRAVSPEPPLLAHTSSESRGTFRQKTRSLAPLNGWTCAVKVCHDGMLEDTNSLGAAHFRILVKVVV